MSQDSDTSLLEAEHGDFPQSLSRLLRHAEHDSGGMMRKLGITLLILIAVPIGCAGYGLIDRWQNAQRFRMTIEVETPDGVKSGSSVIETTFWESGWGPIEARGVRGEARGEAVFVDLGGGRHVIAILGWGPGGYDTDKIYGLTRAALAPGQKMNWKDAPKLKGSGELPADYIPTLVTFSDLNDPKTARVVQPHEFPQVFGEGVRFRSATIEMTRDAVTRNIERQLPWWSGPGRPASIAWRAWLAGQTAGPSIGPETLFVRR